MTAVIWSQCHSMLVTGGPWPEIMVSQLSLLLLGGFNIFIFQSLINKIYISNYLHVFLGVKIILRTLGTKQAEKLKSRKMKEG